MKFKYIHYSRSRCHHAYYIDLMQATDGKCTNCKQWGYHPRYYFDLTGPEQPPHPGCFKCMDNRMPEIDKEFMLLQRLNKI